VLDGVWQAIESTLATTLAVVAVALFDPNPGPLVLAGALALTLSRSRLVGTWRGRAEALIALPITGLATAAVGLLFAAAPIAGAVLFTALAFGSVYLRRFGILGRRIGGLLAIPLITLLIAPPIAPAQGGLLAVLAISVIALAAAVATHLLVSLVHRREPQEDEPAPTESTLRPRVSTRMAIQLAIAIAAAFVVRLLLLPDHWSWVVLSAFLVQSGNRGRADVLLKSGYRVLGAGLGTAAAVLAPSHLLDGAPLVIAVIALLAIGTFLRTFSYAFWAFAVTLIAMLLQGTAGTPTDLAVRLLAILIGAVLGLLPAWLVLPIRSEGVLRRRIAELLRAVEDRITGDASARAVAGAVTRMDAVARPFEVAGRLPMARWRARRDWVIAARDIGAISPDGPPELARYVRRARAAVRDPEHLAEALRELRAELGGR
jgi:hypothetical protein